MTDAIGETPNLAGPHPGDGASRVGRNFGLHPPPPPRIVRARGPRPPADQGAHCVDTGVSRPRPASDREPFRSPRGQRPPATDRAPRASWPGSSRYGRSASRTAASLLVTGEPGWASRALPTRCSRWPILRRSIASSCSAHRSTRRARSSPSSSTCGDIWHRSRIPATLTCHMHSLSSPPRPLARPPRRPPPCWLRALGLDTAVMRRPGGWRRTSGGRARWRCSPVLGR